MAIVYSLDELNRKTPSLLPASLSEWWIYYVSFESTILISNSDLPQHTIIGIAVHLNCLNSKAN